MNRTIFIFPAILSLFSATGLLGQGVRRPKPSFPAEILPSAITVSGLNGKTTSLTIGDLSNLSQQIVKTTDHGIGVTFQGVLLSDVLAKVDTPTGERFRNTAASYYVGVEAADGYRAVFAWAEVDPTFTDRKVYLVFKRDGIFLTERDGPFLIIAPDDKREGRWVRHVRALTIEK